ncbi:B-type flagellin [Planctomycetes bacterium CA13]|uniref:Flagellin n=1 Tax=Novipirellula herctigrandis TaxID=2527986 RepID=A0A5C5YVM0_9BACT|nr:B-type flagellin [Planctomycetes bacterium CA13]
MTRINTNVSSLVAQNRLNQNNNDLQTALTRLSTGLRINSGKDDPAGLIASEALRSEIGSFNKAISNTNRANQIITTADSALGQVSSLLSDVRGLVVEAANTGALSDDEVAANQLQVDSSLEAINRIAQTTTFQGRKLLDGGLDFITKSGTNATNIKTLQIDQANLGATGSVDVTVDISEAATKASVDIEGFRATAGAVDGVQATGKIEFSKEATPAVQSTTGTISTGGAGDFTLTAKSGGSYADDAFNGYAVVIDTVANGTNSSIAIDDTGTGTVTITLEEGETLATAATDLAAHADIAFASIGAVNVAGTDADPTAGTFASGAAAINDTAAIDITSTLEDDAFNGTITWVEADGTTTPTAAFDSGTNTLTVTVEDTDVVDLDAVTTAIDDLADFSAVKTGALPDFDANNAAYANPTITNLAGGTDELLAGVQADVVFELSGTNGSEVFNVSAGTTLDQLVSQINLVKDATGIEAAADGTQLELRSTEYGRDSVVDLRVIQEGAGGNFANGARSVGTDVKASINGREATTKGNKISLNTATLDVQLELEADQTDTSTFSITGGGALFQLGADVVSNQQARIGIGSVSSARLGGTAGKLFQLGSGGSASLSNDANAAAEIVTQAIDQVTGLRGRLGAFQATTLESNMVSLKDTVANLQEAESSIRDADFAQESAALTRAQILTQSGTNVLSMANQNPQNVLSLLR